MKTRNQTLFTRREFCTLAASSTAVLLSGTSNTLHSRSQGSFDGEVLVVGAGPAGMTAAHLLRQAGVNCRVLEASSSVGGRTKHNLEFTDFPIPLGAEWLHGKADILAEIVNDASVDIEIELKAYPPSAEAGYFADGKLELEPDTVFQDDLKFIDSSWLSFFSEYLLPGIEDTITYNTQVVGIDYSGEQVKVTDAAGRVRTADHVIVTIPIKLMQRGDIEFRPALPRYKRKAIKNAYVWSGLKAFIEFDEKFYPNSLAFSDSETYEGQRLYYDAAFGQSTTSNILGLFSVGKQAEMYQALDSVELLQKMLDELDEVFQGMASKTYKRHIVQNWNEEPFAAAAYLANEANWTTSRSLAKSVDNRVHFAGEAYASFDDWGSVHVASRSAFEAVGRILV